MSTAKRDLKRELPGYRARRGAFEVIELPPRRYLAVDGRGDPNTDPAFAEALAALYPVAYRLKFASKAAGRDYVVMPLEALWTADDPALFTVSRDKTRWQWTVLNLVPEWIADEEVRRAAASAAEATDPSPALESLRLLELDEGLCVQTLHVGAFDDEGPVLAHLHDDVIPSHGFRMTGRHHEIYLTDLRRTPPERQRTILRQPVARFEAPAAG